MTGFQCEAGKFGVLKKKIFLFLQFFKPCSIYSCSFTLPIWWGGEASTCLHSQSQHCFSQASWPGCHAGYVLLPLQRSNASSTLWEWSLPAQDPGPGFLQFHSCGIWLQNNLSAEEFINFAQRSEKSNSQCWGLGYPTLRWFYRLNVVCWSLIMKKDLRV